MSRRRRQRAPSPAFSSRRRRKRAMAGLEHSNSVPRGAIPANTSAQAPNNSYSTRWYYVDVAFNCRDCGSAEVWTAEDQKWYYEVVKGPIQATAVRCLTCRRQRRHRHGG